MSGNKEIKAINCRIDSLLNARGMSLTQLAQKVGITYANLSVLKNNHAKAIRFSTLEALCEALDCEVGELFEYKLITVEETTTELVTVGKKAKSHLRITNPIGINT